MLRNHLLCCATRAISATSKTRVKLILNFTRPHAITYTKIHAQQLMFCHPRRPRGGLLRRGNKSGKEMKRRTFTSRAEKAPGNRLLPDHFQTALPMLPPDWAEKSFVLFCPIGEQQLLRYCGVFLHNDFRIAILAWFVHKHSVFEGKFHFNFPRERRNIEMMTWLYRAPISRMQLGEIFILISRWVDTYYTIHWVQNRHIRDERSIKQPITIDDTLWSVRKKNFTSPF